MNNKQYFEDAESSVNERFFSANADYGDDFDEDFVDDYSEDFIDDDNEIYDEVAGGKRGQATTSQPYIITVENTTASAISSPIFMGSYANASGATNFGNVTGIQLSIGITGVTYQEFLFQSMNQPFEIGMTYVLSTNTGQITETFVIRHQDANGNIADKNIIPIVDPYQQQTTSLAISHTYRVDGYTRFTINQVLANTIVSFYMYPSEKINLARAVTGRSAAKGYANPRIILGTVPGAGRPRGLYGRRR